MLHFWHLSSIFDSYFIIGCKGLKLKSKIKLFCFSFGLLSRDFGLLCIDEFMPSEPDKESDMLLFDEVFVETISLFVFELPKVGKNLALKS